MQLMVWQFLIVDLNFKMSHIGITPGDLPKVVCWSECDARGCYSAIFTTYNIPFNKICGQCLATRHL